MKKMFFLMLALLVLGAASMNAQVTIGSDKEPHAGAVLDLQSTTQGLKLPNVTLSSDLTDFRLSGDEATAKGLVVYNNGTAPGIYIWNGSSWNRLSAGTLPAIPASISFSPSIDTPVPPKSLFTISTPEVEGTTSYNWVLPDSLRFVGVSDGSSIVVRVQKTTAGTIDLSGISVAAVNNYGTSARKSATGNITVEEVAPLQPTFTVDRTFINSNGTVTLTCQNVGADSYNWTFPGQQFTGISPTATNKITLQANTDGKYRKGLFTVSATNAYGTSAARPASGDTIFVGDCTSAPEIVKTGAWSGFRTLHGSGNLLYNINSSGRTSIEISVPTGLSISDPTTTGVHINFLNAGIYDGNDVTLTVTNDCGTVSSSFGDNYITVLDPAGQFGPSVEVNGISYDTWIIPMSRPWMIGFSRYGTPDFVNSPLNPEDTDASWYYPENAASACPSPWALPTEYEMNLIRTVSLTGADADARTGGFKYGAYNETGDPVYLNRAYLWVADDKYRCRFTSYDAIRDATTTNYELPYAKPVRCVLDVTPE
jgi:hypothetical protein